MQLHTLKSAEGTKNRKRIGRGDASGWGKTSAKGHKGQNSRSGGGVRRGFEGGTMPYNRRLPKRGFFNKWAKNVLEVNLANFVDFEGDVVDPTFLKEVGFYNGKADIVKIIGKADLKKAITFKAHKFSKGAKESIEKIGGKIEEISFGK